MGMERGFMNVLVVDDSAFMRKTISDMLNSDPKINVVGTARDGQDALKKIPMLHPDVITLDVNMPRMDGLTTLKEIMKNDPIPVVMLSSWTQKGADITIEALEHGAIDYVPKPSGEISLDLEKVKRELILKVKIAAQSKTFRPDLKKRVKLSSKRDYRSRVIAIGASTGGPAAIIAVLSRLPKDTPPILLVQHMPKGFTKSFAERLDQNSDITVKEAKKGDEIVKGVALLAPGDYHMTVTRNKCISLNKKPQIHGVRPSVDPLMTSVADVYGSEAIGIILTGMGRDGSDGVKAIKNKNGQILAQDEESCVVYGMPGEAIKTGCVDKIVPLSRIAVEILRRC